MLNAFDFTQSTRYTPAGGRMSNCAVSWWLEFAPRFRIDVLVSTTFRFYDSGIADVGWAESVCSKSKNYLDEFSIQ